MKVVGKVWECRNLFIEGKLQWFCYARKDNENMKKGIKTKLKTGKSGMFILGHYKAWYDALKKWWVSIKCWKPCLTNDCLQFLVCGRNLKRGGEDYIYIYKYIYIYIYIKWFSVNWKVQPLMVSSIFHTTYFLTDGHILLCCSLLTIWGKIKWSVVPVVHRNQTATRRIIKFDSQWEHLKTFTWGGNFT